MAFDGAITGNGPNRDVEMQVDPTAQAGRVSLRALEYTEPGKEGTGGHFYCDAASGALTGVAANGAIFSCRWNDANYLMVLKRVAMIYYLTTAYTAPQMNDFELICATQFTASDSGGAAVVPSPKRRSRMGQNSAVTDMRMSTTAALTAGTRTLDPTGLRYVADGPPNVAVPTATLAVPRQELVLFDSKEMGAHPKVFGTGEGWIIRAITAMGAAGVIKAFVHAEWAEVRSY